MRGDIPAPSLSVEASSSSCAGRCRRVIVAGGRALFGRIVQQLLNLTLTNTRHMAEALSDTACTRDRLWPPRYSAVTVYPAMRGLCCIFVKFCLETLY